MGVDINELATAKSALSDNRIVESSDVKINQLVKDIYEGNYLSAAEAFDKVIKELEAVYDENHGPEVPDMKASIIAHKIQDLLNSGNTTDALQLSQELVKQYKDDSQVWTIFGNVLFSYEDISAAQEASSRAIRLNRRNTSAWLLLGVCYNYSSQFSKEQASYLKALEYNPRMIELWLNLARSYFLNGNGEDAWHCLGRALMLQPDNLNALRMLTALEEYKDDPEWTEWAEYWKDYLNLAITSYSNNEFGTTSSNTTRLSHLINKGESLRSAGFYHEAMQLFNEALQLDVNSWEAWVSKALTLLNLNNLTEAIPCYERALQLNDSVPYAWIGYANVLIRLGRFKEAHSILEEAFKKGVSNADLRHLMNEVLRMQGKLDEAIVWSNQAIIQDHKDYRTWFLRGRIFEKLGQYVEAISFFSKALSFKPNDIQTLERKTRLVIELFGLEQAQMDLETIIKLNPDHVFALCNLGSVFLKNNNLKSALEYFDRALKLEPHNEVIIHNRQICLKRLVS